MPAGSDHQQQQQQQQQQQEAAAALLAALLSSSAKAQAVEPELPHVAQPLNRQRSTLWQLAEAGELAAAPDRPSFAEPSTRSHASSGAAGQRPFPVQRGSTAALQQPGVPAEAPSEEAVALAELLAALLRAAQQQEQSAGDEQSRASTLMPAASLPAARSSVQAPGHRRAASQQLGAGLGLKQSLQAAEILRRQASRPY